MDHCSSYAEHRPVRAVAVVGLGYVGLPLALLFVGKGYAVIGIDVDAGKVDRLRRGDSYLPDVADDELAAALATDRFQPENGYDRLSEADAVIICVPTPLAADHTPDLSYLRQAAGGIGGNLREGQLVMLESSTYPGTTREVLKPILERASGMTAGGQFSIGYSPERIDPGNGQYTVEQIPKIVSGVTALCRGRAKRLYDGVFAKVVAVSSPEVAELAKIVENTYRLINISFINELAMLCDDMKIDVWEVIEAAKTKPFGFSAFYPGPGIGGHCIPVDPLYLQWRAQERGKRSGFIELADRINRAMPLHIVAKVGELLGHKSNPSILLYGVAYKKDINDARESPALELIAAWRDQGASVLYHDPYIPEIRVNGETLRSIELTDEALGAADCVVLVTDHAALPLEHIIRQAKLVYDTRNATAAAGHHSHVYRFGAGH